MQIGFYLNKQGKYPLYGLTIFVGRAYRASEPNQTRIIGTSFKQDEYNRPASIPIFFDPLPNEDLVYYTATMSARNGMWEEVMEARRVGQQTFLQWVVYGQDSPGVTPNKQLLDLADSGFPPSFRHLPIYPLNISTLPPYVPGP